MTTWFNELKFKYNAGISNFFIITGNIRDYPKPNYMFKGYLFERLEELGMEEVVEFDLLEESRVRVMCEELEDSGHKKAVIINYPELMFPKSSNGGFSESFFERFIILYDTLVNSERFIGSDNVLIFLTEDRYSLHEQFLNASTRSTLIEVGYPDEIDRFYFIKYLQETSNVKIKKEVEDKHFAKLSAGLTLVGIEDIYLQAEKKGILKREFIIERKNELIKKEYGDLLEVMDPEGLGFKDFAGSQHLKDYHMEAIVKPIILRQTDIIPKGILYVGPPGTGKTYFAKCFSGEAGMNFVELKMSRILDKWVGESEKRFSKALTCIKSIAPVGVFIDEFDQSFSRGDGESNTVNKSLFGMFLAVLSEPENRGKIIWIGAANYPNRIDDALKRVGRFDKKMPFLPPNKMDRIKVMQIHLKKSRFKINITEGEFGKLGDKTKGYTQAEIEGVVIKAKELATRKNEDVISCETMDKAVNYIRTPKNNNIKEMIDLAIEECNDLEFLPDRYRSH